MQAVRNGALHHFVHVVHVMHVVRVLLFVVCRDILQFFFYADESTVTAECRSLCEWAVWFRTNECSAQFVRLALRECLHAGEAIGD